MPPASPVPGWSSGEVCTDSVATRCGRESENGTTARPTGTATSADPGTRGRTSPRKAQQSACPKPAQPVRGRSASPVRGTTAEHEAEPDGQHGPDALPTVLPSPGARRGSAL